MAVAPAAASLVTGTLTHAGSGSRVHRQRLHGYPAGGRAEMRRRRPVLAPAAADMKAAVGGEAHVEDDSLTRTGERDSAPFTVHSHVTQSYYEIFRSYRPPPAWRDVLRAAAAVTAGSQAVAAKS